LSPARGSKTPKTKDDWLPALSKHGIIIIIIIIIIVVVVVLVITTSNHAKDSVQAAVHWLNSRFEKRAIDAAAVSASACTYRLHMIVSLELVLPRPPLSSFVLLCPACSSQFASQAQVSVHGPGPSAPGLVTLGEGKMLPLAGHESSTDEMMHCQFHTHARKHDMIIVLQRQQ
jgi:hypothetical protein